MITYMFPGQGSQKKGMGEELFREFPEMVKIADRVLGYSIERLCLEDPEEQLNLTQFTQPALFTVNALSYYHEIKETGRKPDFVAGHSLGEYNALLAAEVFDFETGLKLVKKRGELMGRASGGAMAAVLHLTEDKVKDILNKYHFDGIDIANLNEKGQTVISGKAEDIHAAQSIFEKEGASYVKLKVSAAFHSRYMADAKAEFGEYIKNYTFAEPHIPIISNVTALPHESGEIKTNMVNQLCASVKWTDSVRYLLSRNCTEFIELGPGKVLTRLVAKIKKETPVTLSGDAEEMVAEWNRRYPVGTKVTCKGYSEKLTTRTKAMVLFGHRSAVYMEGYNGYFALEDVMAE